MKSGRAQWQKAEATRKDPSGQENLYLRALQGLSGRNLIDPSLQDNVLIPNGFFEYIYHIGCAINLHSIPNSGLIPGGQNLSKRHTVFFTSADLMDKEHRDPNKFDLEAPCLVWYKQKKWKKHQDTVYWVDIKLAPQKFYVLSNTIERHHPLRHTPGSLCPESYHNGNWRSHIREIIFVTSTSSEDFF